MIDSLALGIDLGGTSIKWGVVTTSGGIVQLGKLVLEDHSPSFVITKLKTVIENRRMEFKENLSVIGIGTPGLLDRERKTVRTSPNFPEWEDIHLFESLAEGVDKIPIYMENDANLLVYSETTWGAAIGSKDVIVITLGTGVGGGILSDGHLVTGFGGGGGEVGHISIEPEGRRCGCGSFGCLEAYCGIQGIMRTADGLFFSCPTTPEEISQAAKGGDQRALEVFRKTGRWLGIGLATMINLLNPQYILLGGGIAGAGDILIQSAREEAKKRSYLANWNDVTITFAKLGVDSGLMGAAALGFIRSGVLKQSWLT